MSLKHFSEDLPQGHDPPNSIGRVSVMPARIRIQKTQKNTLLPTSSFSKRSVNISVSLWALAKAWKQLLQFPRMNRVAFKGKHKFRDRPSNGTNFQGTMSIEASRKQLLCRLMCCSRCLASGCVAPTVSFLVGNEAMAPSSRLQSIGSFQALNRRICISGTHEWAAPLPFP